MLTMFADSFVFRTAEALAFQQPTIRFADPRSVSVTEGNDGERFASFRIVLSEAASEEVRVRVDTQTYASSGWATEGVDYAGVHRTITFLPGQVAKTVKVKLFGDTVYEPDEMFTLQLSGVRGAELDPDVNVHTAYVRLIDDELPPLSGDWMV